MKRLFWVAMIVSLTMNYAQALKCMEPSKYWKDDTTGIIYFGQNNSSTRNSTEGLAHYNFSTNADEKSFDGLRSATYAKDNNHVYLFGKIVPSANPKTYGKVEALGNKISLFIKDDKHLYFKYKAVIHDGDLATVQVFDQHFSRDKDFLYFNGYEVPNINPDTFKAISWKPDPPDPYWGWGCDFFPDIYINEATDGKQKVTYEELMEKYGSWREVK